MSDPSGQTEPLLQPAASVPEDPEYESEEDEDFSPDAEATAADSEGLSDSSADSDDGGASTRKEPKAPKAKKRKQRDDLEVELASGDEATIRKGKRRKQKRTPKDGKHDAEETDYDDDEGGEGGLIKTRAQRAKEKKERKPLASATGATVDVDALWASMSAVPVAPLKPPLSNRSDTLSNGHSAATLDPTMGGSNPEQARSSNSQRPLSEEETASVSSPGEELITIQRTYTFAGTTTTETKRVPAQSAEARLYLQSLNASANTSSKPTTMSNPVRRPKKRSSLFDPKAAGGEGSKGGGAPKLNTIEKSKLDWAGYVDKEEGLREELDGHGRGKEGYLGRMEFLADVERKRDEDARRARGV